MNERLMELYYQAIILEGNGDYVTGELDPFKFAELIIRECARKVTENEALNIFEHFGVEE